MVWGGGGGVGTRGGGDTTGVFVEKETAGGLAKHKKGKGGKCS